MDKSEAIELLKQALTEIPQLKHIHHDNQQFILWHDKVRYIIMAAFDTEDVKRFSSWQSIHLKGLFSDDVYQQDYLKRIQDYETALKSIIQKHELLGMEENPAQTTGEQDTVKSPIQLFDSIELHPKVIEASRKLFQDEHYRDAIYRAFVEVNNFVKSKAKSQLDGKDLMSKVFRLDNPIIKLNPLVTQSDKNEQEGFMLLSMGAMEGIRNPKAHENIAQNDPFRTLEYLSFASLLMKRIEEGELVKTSRPRKQWNLHRFLNDIENRCSEVEINVIKELYSFTKENADSIYWGTGVETGSFTFHKTKRAGNISIISVFSDGSICLNFGYMKDKGVRKDILESFRDKLNKITSIKIPQNAVISNKFPSIRAEILTVESNIKLFKQVILELCQQLDEEE